MQRRAAVRLAWQEPAAEEITLPGQLVSIHPGDGHLRLIQGDNATVLRCLRTDLAGQITFAYLDPPFFTGRVHERTTRSRDRSTGKILRHASPAFDDRWRDLSAYLLALRARVTLLRDLLAPHGSFVLHVDPRTSHYAKVMCDEIFGIEAFASEIVWRYRRWPAKTENFQRVHDVLLRYVRDATARPRFAQLYEPLAPSTVATWGTKKQRAVQDAEGRRARSSTTEEHSPGTPMGDVWDIGILAPMSRERTGYPTQKPEALLERLVLACSAPGDLILDPYAGSGTTLAVGARLGRKVIGVDESAVALSVAWERLRAMGLSPSWERAVAAEGGRVSEAATVERHETESLAHCGPLVGVDGLRQAGATSRLD